VLVVGRGLESAIHRIKGDKDEKSGNREGGNRGGGNREQGTGNRGSLSG